MTLYSLDGNIALARLAGRIIVPDSSYIIDHRLANNRRGELIRDFHTAVERVGAQFCFNEVIRLEILSKLRYIEISDIMIDLAENDLAIAARYCSAARIPDNANMGMSDVVREKHGACFKTHISNGDLALITSKMTVDYEQEIKRYQDELGLQYMDSDPAVFQETAHLARVTCADSRDACIAGLAVVLGGVVVTCDKDFSVLSVGVDVYMPNRRAIECQGFYDAVVDNAP